MQSHDDSSTRAGTVRSKAITRNDDHHQVVTLPVYSQSAPAETPESRFSSSCVSCSSSPKSSELTARLFFAAFLPEDR